MDQFDNDVMDDLFYDSAEGPARTAFEDEAADEYDDDGFDEGDDEFLGRIGAAVGGLLSGDEFDEGDEFEADEYGDEYEDIDSLEDAVADAMEAEDTDEFLRRLRRIARGAVNVARRVGRGVGQAARVVGPIA